MKKLIILLTIFSIFSCKKEENASISTQFETETAFSDEFDYQNTPGGYNWLPEWIRATWTMNSSLMGEERAAPDGNFMNLTVTAGSPFQGGCIQTREEYQYGKWVARLKPSSVAGVVNAMFTNDWDDENTSADNSDGTHEEIDIEFLPYTFTGDNGQVHLALHNRESSNIFNKDIELGFDPSTDFHEWGFEIYQDSLRWLVDDKILASYVYDNEFRVTSTYTFFFNAWTNSSTWVKGPPSQDALYQIDWVRFYPLKH